MKFVDSRDNIYIPTRWLSFNDVLLRPQYSRFNSRNDESISTASCLGYMLDEEASLDRQPVIIPNDILKLDIPIISANMDTVTGPEMAKILHNLGGLGVIHRFYRTKEQYVEAIEEVCSKTGKAAFSVGSGKEWVDFAKYVYEKLCGNVIVVLDIAHAHSLHAIETVKQLRQISYDVSRFSIIAGNVAFGDGAVDLAQAGANVLKIGVGCGSVCSTRLVTGHGTPQLSAIMEARKTLDSFGYENVGIIADGGIRYAGDIVKSLAAGADAVMIGQLFAGTDESPGEVLVHSDGSKTKSYRGQSSRNFMNEIGKNGVAAEGIHVEIPYKGSVKQVIQEMVGGLRSGMTYSGAGSIRELRENAVFMEISEQGWIESIPHATLTVR